MNTTCPQCGYKATDHTQLFKDGAPADGDISFCIKCAGINEFLNDTLVKVDIDSLDEGIRRQVKEIETAWLRTKWQRDKDGLD